MSNSADILPGLGRNGLVNSVRKLSGATVTGYRAVDATAQFIAGQVATLVDNGGVATAAVANNSSTAAIGLFFCHKTVSFYRPVVNESVTVVANHIILANANILSSSLKVTSTTGTPYATPADFGIVSTTNGILSRNGSGAIGATDTVLVSYRYKDPNLSGIDQTLGSGNAAILEEPAEVATLVYDTSRTYVLNQKLYINADGILTNAAGSLIMGIVTGVPTNDNPNLNFKLKIQIV